MDVVRQFNVRLEVCSFRLQVWWMLSANIKWDWRYNPSRPCQYKGLVDAMPLLNVRLVVWSIKTTGLVDTECQYNVELEVYSLTDCVSIK